MFRVLQIILRRNRVSPCMSVSRELEILFRDMMRVAAYFDVGAVRLVGSRKRIRATPIVRRPAAHPLVLTWSHFNFLISIPVSPELFRSFRRNFLEFDARETVHAFASFERADLITPGVRT
jgi:hypothetical protein